MMNTHREIHKILTDTWDRQGWSVPEPATEYICRVLVNRIEQPDWQPKPSYAERWMTLQTAEQALELGDTCFFARSVFPEYLERRGISSSYFVEMGQGCYDLVLRRGRIPALNILRQHFEWLAEMTYTAVHSHGDFRSMWD